ncbi:MAG: PQQ-dependent sugar dehydrogenase [Cyclobacteriaceae bacterium]|nr:PQQ-dependent sugar dehydrogenase [Cyclobacteriaceae bacterium]
MSLLLLASCGLGNDANNESNQDMPARFIADEDQGGIYLADGFQAYVVAEVGGGRHITVRDNGDIYVKLSNPSKSGGAIAAIRDTDNDGRADTVAYFGDYRGTGMEFHNGYLYASSDSVVYRYEFDGDALVPKNADNPDVLISGFTSQRQHANKNFTFDGKGNIYVNVGAPSNACQEQDRSKGSEGMDPCPWLELHGGIWQFDANKLGQTQVDDGVMYATGIRNAVAVDWNFDDNELYVVQHGRDMLYQLYPEMFDEEASAEKPAEEFFKVTKDSNFGWPYCYFDPELGHKVWAPEYGGDGKEIRDCDEFDQPILTFPAHWAPNDLLFYTGDQFPKEYKNSALIAFHGSWNRAPLEQKGYHVAFVPFENGEVTGEYSEFAEGFAQVESIEKPSDAKYRPMGLAMDLDGSVLIVDSHEGKIWRVFYHEAPTKLASR